MWEESALMVQNNYRKGSGSSQQHVYRKQKPKPRKRKRNTKFLTVVTFLLLLTYLCGHIVRFLNKPSISVETVNYGTVDVPKVLNGIIVRDEFVAKSTMAGQPVFHYSEKEKIKKNALVCQIKNVDNTVGLEEQIKKIDQNILEVQKSRSDISVFQDDINDIQKRITNSFNASIYKFIDGSIADIYSLRSQIETQINRRNQIWLLENNQSLTELSAEKNQYETQLADNISAMRAEFSGILSFSIDKQEEVLTPDTLDNITEEQTKMNVKPDFISKSQPVEEGSPVFKIIKSNIWYLASYIPNDICVGWKAGDTKMVTATANEEEKTISTLIDRIVPGEKTTYVVFRIDNNLLDFMDSRSLAFTVQNNIYTGIKIPNNAIIEKTLLKIPLSCITESVGEKGVIKRVNNVDSFVNVKITKSDEGGEDGITKYAYVLQDFDNLRVGDWILNGTGAEAALYEISEVETYKGVFVANSSIAKFTIIDILGENEEYTIVKPSDGHYGLKVYDNIVSDAKNVQDSDIIY